MDLRRAADMVLRSHSSPLAAFLMPSMRPRWQSIGTESSRRTLQRPLNRGFSTTSRRFAESPEKKAPSSSNEKGEEKSEKPAEARKPNTTWSGTPRSYSGMFESPDYKPSNQGRLGNTATDLANALKPLSRPGGFDASRMAQPPRRPGSNMMASLNQELAAFAEEQRIPIRLDPSAGRVVNVGQGMDVGRAFQVLNAAVAKNKIKTTMMKQKFHERPGLKRKRLKSIRWRRKFMQGFRDAVKRVKELKKQGW